MLPVYSSGVVNVAPVYRFVVCALPVVPILPFGTTELSPTKIPKPEGPKGLPDELLRRIRLPPLRVIGAADAGPIRVPDANKLAISRIFTLLMRIPQSRSFSCFLIFQRHKNVIKRQEIKPDYQPNREYRRASTESSA